MSGFQRQSPAAVKQLPVLKMARFRRLMRREGWSVDLARMCMDRGYVFECLALAHTSVCLKLRRAALDLFSTYDRHSLALALH